jgi:hypothetical protein
MGGFRLLSVEIYSLGLKESIHYSPSLAITGRAARAFSRAEVRTGLEFKHLRPLQDIQYFVEFGRAPIPYAGSVQWTP